MEKLQFFYNEKVYDPHYGYPDCLTVADALLRKAPRSNLKVLDLGCGAGHLGLSLKFMHPDIDLTLCDIDKEAVKIAKRNARDLKLKATVKKAGIEEAKEDYDIIITNLPSFTDEQMKDTPHKKEHVYDPHLKLYKELFDTAKAPIIVHEIQEKRKGEAHLIATGRGYVEILAIDHANAWLKKKPILSL